MQIIITIDGSTLKLAATDGLSIAEINLWLDVAKRQVLLGEIDETLPPAITKDQAA